MCAYTVTSETTLVQLQATGTEGPTMEWHRS